MEKWLESVYSDGTAAFVSHPSPALRETVTVSLRLYEHAPVRRVYLRTTPNGEDRVIEMRRDRVERGLAWYVCELTMTEKRLHYHFYLVTDRAVYFYTQRGITTYVPDHTYDFQLLTDYVQPAWVKKAVFYQIFPDRFYNGDPENDVKTGEYTFDGHPSLHRAWEDEVLTYEEGHCLDFYGGDLEGIRQKIPYLRDLGVTALYLNPIFRAPSVHKYDCVDYLAVDEHLGGDEALARLAEALHENGMRLVLDISINHTGTAHRWFNRDGLFFPFSEGAYHNPESEERGFYFFGEGDAYAGWWDLPELPVLNYTSDALRDRVYRGQASVLRHWLRRPFSIDGWRFDVADVFARRDEVQLSHEVWPEIRRAIREENPEAYILAEDWGDCAEYLRGDEWDSPMNYYGCGRPVRQFLGEPDVFLSRVPALRDIPYKMTAADLEGRVMEHLAKLPWAIWENQFNLFDSHDITRLHTNPRVDPGEYRGAVMLLFTLPGAASIYYGDEAEAGGTVGTNEGCRWPFPWGKDFRHTETFRLYRTLAHLKREHPALSEGGFKILAAEGCVFAAARFTRDEAFVTVVSTEPEEREVRLPFAAVGAAGPAGETDALGTRLCWREDGDGGVLLTVPAHQAYFIPCAMLPASK